MFVYFKFTFWILRVMFILMRRYQNPKATLIYTMIAVGLFIFTDLFLLGGYQDLKGGSAEAQTVQEEYNPDYALDSEAQDYHLSKQMMSAQERRESELMSALGTRPPFAEIDATPTGNLSTASVPDSSDTPEPGITYDSWKSFTLPENAPQSQKPKIAIVIDDLGINMSRTQEINDLPGPVTMAFLPYAPQLEVSTKAAKDAGHELLIHVPMQPLNASLDPGPMALRTEMNREDFDVTLSRIFESFDGYLGVNNHMGSALTQDIEKMGWLMETLAKRGLFFVDSKTIHTSVALGMAQQYGIYHAKRDVFLDHEPGPEFVRMSLEKLEFLARKNGMAVAIGHPKGDTIAVLKEWIPTLEEKGFELVPVSHVVKARDLIADQKSIAPEIMPSVIMEPAIDPHSAAPIGLHSQPH